MYIIYIILYVICKRLFTEGSSYRSLFGALQHGLEHLALATKALRCTPYQAAKEPTGVHIGSHHVVVLLLRSLHRNGAEKLEI